MRSSALVSLGLIGMAIALGGFRGAVRIVPGPQGVPYLCEGGQTANAVYENGSDFRHAQVRLTFEGRTTEMEAAPTLYGMRYRNEPNAEESRHLIWAVWGERAWLSEATEPYRSDREGPRLLNCHRRRGGATAPMPSEAH